MQTVGYINTHALPSQSTSSVQPCTHETTPQTVAYNVTVETIQLTRSAVTENSHYASIVVDTGIAGIPFT